MKRIEDPDLLRGRARFVDDIRLPLMVEAAFVRSPHAHALIRAIDTRAALAVPGVHAVLTLADLRPFLRVDAARRGLAEPGLSPGARPSRAGGRRGGACRRAGGDRRRRQPLSAPRTRQRSSRSSTSRLPAVADCRAALAADAPARPSRRAAQSPGAVHHGIWRCRACIRRGAASLSRFRSGSIAAAPFDRGPRRSGVRGSARRQAHAVELDPDAARGAAPAYATCSGATEQLIRVVTPEVGGGFGPKLVFYPEDVATAVAAIALRRPVKWIEDRREHFVATTQERDQYWQVEIAFDDAGRILGVRGTHDPRSRRLYRARRQPAVRIGADRDLALRRAGLSARRAARAHQQGAGDAGARRGPAAGRVRDGAAPRPRRARAGHRPRRAAPAQSRYAGAHAVHEAARRRAAATPSCSTAAIIRGARSWRWRRPAGRNFRRARSARGRTGASSASALANFVKGTGRGPFESVRVRIGAVGQGACRFRRRGDGAGHEDHAGADRRGSAAAAIRRGSP